MATIGHEAPLRDNMNPARLGSGEPLAPQLQIGQEAPEPEPVPEELPPELRLTEEEHAKVDKLVETGGLDRLTAILYSVPRAKARRIIGHAHAARQVDRLKTAIEERKQKENPPGPTTEELVELLRSTSPRGTDSPAEPTNKAA